MNSIWTKQADLPRFHSLEGDRKTDVLIIGGGMAGILCAYFLEKQGVNYLLVEKSRICSGITENTTAKITAQHGLLYHKLLKNAGEEKAKMYLDANQKAAQEYVRLCRKIDCDFEKKTSYVYSMNNRKKLEKEAEALEKLGMHCGITDAAELPFPTAGAVSFENQAQFHPLKFIANIAKGRKIYENTLVKAFEKNLAITDKGKIAFKKVIFTTHFPIDNKHGMYFLKMYQHRSYVIAMEDACQLQGMYVDEARNGMSFRNYKQYLLLGGGGHRTGKQGGNWSELREFAKKCYPKAIEKYHWAAQDCMSLDGIPYIGQYSKNMPGCFAATGFNKWGMTSSMVSAMILTDMILEKENPYAKVFSPSRNMIKPQLFVNGWESTIHLLTFSKKRCPHLGCALKWNADEHSWDCPCHGSRFEKNGKLLDNPANGDLKER